MNRSESETTTAAIQYSFRRSLESEIKHPLGIGQDEIVYPPELLADSMEEFRINYAEDDWKSAHVTRSPLTIAIRVVYGRLRDV